MGEAALSEKRPKAMGYLRPREGYRLFEKRDALTARLVGEVEKNKAWLLETLRYPLVRGGG